MAGYDVLAPRWRRATILCLVALLIVIAIKAVFFQSESRALGVSLTVWVMAALPLLIFVPGIRRAAINSFAWLSFVTLLYFLYGVLALFAPSRHWLDALHLFFSIMLFICAMLSVRFTARAKRAASQP